jgi:hypothetical protein
MFNQCARANALWVRVLAVGAVFSVTALAAVVLSPSQSVVTAAVVAGDPDPFELPAETVAREVTGHGYIRSATQRTEHGTEAAEIRALGFVWTDEGDRDPGENIEWDDLIELGAIENVGTETATISFESGMIIDLGPGEVLFVNNLLSEAEIADELVAVANCTCTCTCQADPQCGPTQFSVPCSETNYKCSEFNGDGCTVGDSGHPFCTSTLTGCHRHWNWLTM